ncbi:hypothetical protein BLOT_003463 [Blomia tropicalis]|nr:hypothetical protein BLOT_003463 [Blomia tropicalis]
MEYDDYERVPFVKASYMCKHGLHAPAPIINGQLYGQEVKVSIFFLLLLFMFDFSRPRKKENEKRNTLSILYSYTIIPHP